MKTIRSFAGLGALTVALLATCFGARLASAQEVRGSFTLPSETHWGMVTLPAGDYTFTLDKAQSAATLRLMSGGREVGMLHPQAYNPKTAARSFLTITRERGVGTVNELTLSDPGVRLYFAPYRANPRNAAEERQMARVVRVTVPSR